MSSLDAPYDPERLHGLPRWPSDPVQGLRAASALVRAARHRFRLTFGLSPARIARLRLGG
jgi:hypothetical protein